jgi:dTDP-4-dehydrorhamnose 3,5-epimerase|tara:strand:- start:1263 stop:1709 length:447 start_codon:yes stop_codon:yes gene_type:complete
MENEKTKLISGGLSVDDRGSVSYVNDFNFKNVKRFYIVNNHKRDFIRAWHAHKNEAKYVMIVKGSALIGAVAMDNWEQPSKKLSVDRYVLSDESPSILYIPKGYANGFMTLTENCKIIFFSTSTLEESINDDYRFDALYWNPWHIVQR